MRAVFIDTVGHILSEFNRKWCLSLKQAGVEVILITNDAARKEETNSISARYLFQDTHGNTNKIVRGINYLTSWRRVLAELAEIKPDIVHFQFGIFPPLDITYLSGIKKMGAKMVINAHDILPLEHRFYHPVLYRRLYELADAVVVFNENNRRELTGLFANPERVSVIPIINYITPEVKNVVSVEKARADLGLPQDAVIFLNLGCIKRAKGLSTLLTAAKRAIAMNNRITVLVAGQIWKDKPDFYKKLIKKLEIEKNVIFRPWYVDDADIEKYYSAADAVVFPYLKVYQSASIFFAFAYRRAVIATDISGLSEWVVKDETGILIPPGDEEALAEKMLDIAGNPGLREQLAGRGYNHWRRMAAPDQIGKMTAALYQKVVEDAR